MTEPTVAPFSALAASLSAAAPEIIDRYQAALAAQGNQLLRSESSRAQVLDHARELLRDLIETFSGQQAATTRRNLAADIGSNRAAQGFHPGESLRAAGALFEVVLRVAAANSSTDPAVATVMAVALAMNDALVRAIGTAADSYAAFQLDRIHSAHVEERRRISRELHDRIGHGINVAYRNTELYAIERQRNPEAADLRVAAAADALRELLDAVPQVISDLRAAEPVDSLEKALRYAIDAIDVFTPMIHLQVTGDEHWASPEIRDEAFLIIREAMRNTIAHACASALLIRVQITPDNLRAVIRDDGIGYEPAAGRPGRAGVTSMRERAALLGGSLTVTGIRGRGTTVDFTIPCDRRSGRG